MTIQDVKNEIEKIKSIAGDDEVMHSGEDGLRAKFIEHIAALDIPVYAEMARLVLTTDNIEFSRWCA